MATRIQLRRGLESQVENLAEGELGYATDTNELYIGTGDDTTAVSGNKWYFGTKLTGKGNAAYTFSTCPMVKKGDVYCNSATYDIYICETAGSGTDATWRYKGCIKGDKGTSSIVSIDGELDGRSENAVKNKTIAEAIQGTQIALLTLLQSISLTDAEKKQIGLSLEIMIEGWMYIYEPEGPDHISQHDNDFELSAYRPELLARLSPMDSGDITSDMHIGGIRNYNTEDTWEFFTPKGVKTTVSAANTALILFTRDLETDGKTMKAYKMLEWPR